MADRGPVKIREGRVNQLIGLYKTTYAKLFRDIIRESESGKIRKAKVMARIRIELERLGVDVEKWTRQEIPQYYLDGANVALQDLKRIGVDVGVEGAAAINAEAIKALTDETLQSFGESMRGISRSASRFIDNALKQQINFIIAEGRLTGEARRTVSDAIAEQLRANGLPALRDAAGKSWQADRYAAMLVRTKAVEARNQGLANKMLQNGYDLVQVTDHGTEHLACKKWEGKILSLTGKTKGYPTLEDAKAGGLFHPNCEHAINVINLDLAKKTNAYDPVSRSYIKGDVPTADNLNDIVGSRKENDKQKAMEAALNSGNRTEAQRIVNTVKDADLKRGLQSTLDALSGKQRKFRIDPKTKKIVPL